MKSHHLLRVYYQVIAEKEELGSFKIRKVTKLTIFQNRFNPRLAGQHILDLMGKEKKLVKR